MQYYFNKSLSLSFDEAVSTVTEALMAEGFGILTEIDVKATLKKKLGVDFRQYKILGACNPGYAHKALMAEPHIGLMLPCNVLVQEFNDGVIEVSAIDPAASMQAIENSELVTIAGVVRDKLKAVIENL